jgi:hypothetical protein
MKKSSLDMKRKRSPMRRLVVLVLALSFALHTTTAFVLAAAAQGTARLSGTARSSNGQPIPNDTAQLRNVETGQLGGSTACDSSGGFLFTGLNPGNYVVEIVNGQGAIIGTSAVAALAAGGSVTMAVTAATAAAVAVGGGISLATIVTALAAAAGVATATVLATRPQASPSQ